MLTEQAAEEREQLQFLYAASQLYLLFKQCEGCVLHTTQDGNVPVNNSVN
jgi:hypothetical protein